MCGVGTLFLDKCQAQYLIPIYLIVNGAVLLFVNLCSMVVSTYQRKNPDCEASGAAKFYNVVNSVMGCFSLAWFIAGEL